MLISKICILLLGILFALVQVNIGRENIYNSSLASTTKIIELENSTPNYSSKGEIIMTTNFNISGGNQGAVGTDPKASNFVQISSDESKKNLFEASQEIQKLLDQLQTTNPDATESEKIAYLNEKTTLSFKERVAGALKGMGESAIDEFVLDNKYLKVVKAAIKGWLQAGS
jgi:hypothetical protein